jgi:hypothetical protein
VPALDDPVREHPEVLVEQQYVGRILGDVDRGVDRHPYVGLVQRERVVHAVAEESDRSAAGSEGGDDPALLLGRDAREYGDALHLVAQRRVIELVHLGAGHHPSTGHPQLLTHPLRDLPVVARGDPHVHAEGREPGQGLRRARFGRVNEADEAHQLQS